jgi:hypothetical protein
MRRIFLGMDSSSNFKAQWFNPNVKTIARLRGIASLILGHIKIHFYLIQDGNAKYFGIELYGDHARGPCWQGYEKCQLRGF